MSCSTSSMPTTPRSETLRSGSGAQIGVLSIAEAAAEDQQSRILPRVERVRNAALWPASKSVGLVVVTRAHSVERTNQVTRAFLL